MRHPEFGYWSPSDVDRRKWLPEPGDIVTWGDFKPWVVIDIREGVPHKDNPGAQYTVYRMRPVGVDGNKQDIHRGWVHGGPTVLNEHYGLCVHCGELLPCRALMAERAAKTAAERMARYDTPGICPECAEPVTHRQERETFPNIVVPAGPPVTFHAGRRKCRFAMNQYRDKVGQQESQLRLDGGELFS